MTPTPTEQVRCRMRLAEFGLAKIDWSGGWVLTREGRDFLDMLDELRSLDDRAGADCSSAPRRQAQSSQRPNTASPPTGNRPGDDRRTARAAQEKNT